MTERDKTPKGIRHHEDVTVADCKRVLVTGCADVVVINSTNVNLIGCLGVEETGTIRRLVSDD